MFKKTFSPNLPTKVRDQVGAHSSCNMNPCNMVDDREIKGVLHMDCNNRHSKGMGQNTTTVDPSNRNGNLSNECELCRGEACQIRMYILPCYLNKYENYINASKSTNNMQCNSIHCLQTNTIPRIV